MTFIFHREKGPITTSKTRREKRDVVRNIAVGRDLHDAMARLHLSDDDVPRVKSGAIPPVLYKFRGFYPIVIHYKKLIV